jgi:C4-dicarboxylate-specific signal transduction histidine kinase
MVAMVAAYAALALYCRLVLRTQAVHTHLAYVPIVFSGIWWGRRGLVVALALAAFTVLMGVVGHPVGMPWDDTARSVAFLGVSFVVGHLSEQARARQQAERKKRELLEVARKQEEQLVHSTRLAELGEMAAAIAHELKQPLTGIRNFARNAFYMLEQKAGTEEEVKENLRMISGQVDRASHIISQMRDLTRKAEPEYVPLDANAVVRESVDFLAPQLKLAGVETVLDLAADLPPVSGDRTRLEQVLLNIITNARQAMEGAPVRRLTIGTCLGQDGERPVSISIRDTGRGFTAEQARKLFTPFYSTKEAGHGTGLGLSISQTIVKEHGGRIEAASTPGQGATFTLRLPAAREEDGAKQGGPQ